MKKLIIIFIIYWPALLFAQKGEEISLKQCLSQAEKNYPLAGQKELFLAAGELKQQVINSALLPQFMLNGQVSYQSEVTSFPINLPNVNMPQISKDWYKLNLDVSQLIYDGGALKKQEELEHSNTQIEIQSVEIELYKVKEMVQSAYFNILLLNENKEAILLLQQELEEKLKTVSSAVKNGLMLPANSDNLKAELIKIDQNLFEIESGINSAIKSLNILTGLDIKQNDVFVTPSVSENIGNEITRPEIALFDLQVSKINLLKEITSLKRAPKIAGFGQAGYGRPGLNMLSNDFEPFFVVGAKINWNLFDWGNSKKEKKTFDIQSRIVQKNKEAFNANIEVAMAKKQSEIQRLENLILNDEQIVKLKSNVAKTASSQFDNGVITATEYLTEKNAETRAFMNLQLHKIQLVYAWVDYEFTLGNSYQ